MTKQEYETKNQQLRDAYICDSDYFGRLVDVDSEYIESLEAENAALTLLHTQATDEMLKMQNRVHKLEAEIAQLQADNCSLVEQMNEMALQPNQEVIEKRSPHTHPTGGEECVVVFNDGSALVDS